MPILIKRPDGGVSIMHLNPDLEVNVELELQKWSEVTGPYDSYEEVDESAIPPKCEYRNSLGHDLKPRMPLARETLKDKMRRAREPKLLALDVEFRRAGRDPAKEANIEARAQVLRDVTADPRIEAAKTLDELKAIWPEVLGPKT